MRWDFGQVYKEVRTSKGLTQKEVCGNEIARSTLANIESGRAVPNVENMIFLLNQVDMTVEEFRYICNYYKISNRQKILNLTQQFIAIPSHPELVKLISMCESYLAQQHDLAIRNCLNILKVYVHIREKGIYDRTQAFQELIEEIWSYLEKQNTWYMSDFRLLNTILFHFSLKSLPHIVDRILENLEKYKEFSNITNIQRSILVNLSTIYLKNNCISDCEKISNLVLDLAKKLKRYDTLGLAQIRLGICRKDRDLVDKGLALLQLTEEDELLETMEKEVSQYF